MNEPQASAAIFCAIDTPSLDDAVGLARRLNGVIGGIKLGSEFYTANGPEGVREITIAAPTQRLFLDLKFHDIANTVAGSVRAATALSPYMLNVHASGGAVMLRAAAEAAAEEADRLGIERPLVIGVTVLTSLDGDDLAAVGQSLPVADQALRLALLSQENGLDGVVCSAHEIATLRARCGPEFTLVVPGIRPSWAETNEQKRIMAPAAALTAGADFLIIGRPITGAADAAEAARRVIAEIAGS
ncbi:MAG: orotidine-5'-phosphate decarboxylase [Proteobacteria bacterium]|nr:orotidine-5'-phosphate decarboxylase [Pseudomonadota bacterium]